MSDDKVVNILKQQHRTLDETVHGLAKETARIKDIGLKNQDSIASVKNDTEVIKARVTVLEHKFDELKAEFDGMKAEFGGMKAEFGGMKTQLDRIRAAEQEVHPFHWINSSSI